MRNHWTSRALTVTAGAGLAGTLAWSAPAQADPADDAFLNSLGGTGIDVSNPAATAALGQSVCPMLTQPAGSLLSVVSGLTGSDGGMSPELAEMFAEAAVDAYCPQMLAEVANGQTPTVPPELAGPGRGIPAIPGLPGGIPGLPGGIPGL